MFLNASENKNVQAGVGYLQYVLFPNHYYVSNTVFMAFVSVLVFKT